MTTPRSHFWADLTTRDFEQWQANGTADRLVAVLPVAATEQHGPHLPLSVDTALLEGLIQRTLAEIPADLPVLFLPTQAVGKSNEHQAFPGTLTLSSETLLRLWLDIGASVARAGVKKLLILNSHGGQASAMDLVARDLRVAHGLIVVGSSWYNLPLGEKVGSLFSAEEHRFGVHAGEIETSMMLALRPDLVDMQQAQHFKSTSQDRAARYPVLGNGVSAKLGWQMQDYNPQGAAGQAHLATAEKGQQVLTAAAQQLAQLLQEIVELPLSTLVSKGNAG